MTSAPLKLELQALIREFADWWATRGRELDAANEVREPLYHYTNMAGLLGIVSSEEMWFTNILHLNDPRELGYGIGIARDILEAEANGSGNQHVAGFCAWALHVLVKAGGEIFGFYVASFSRESNDLGQWRAYADNGRGVAVGLSPTLFALVADQSTLGVTDKTMAANVTYDRAECEQNFREAIQRAVAIFARGLVHITTDLERKEFGEELARELAVPMFRHAITSKHPSYAHERETRLLLLNDRAELDHYSKFRTRGSTLVPYVPSALRVRSPGAITKIVVGPAADVLADDAVRAFLRRHGLSEEIVEKSEIPYTAL
jgi:hypothetical protein